MPSISETPEDIMKSRAFDLSSKKTLSAQNILKDISGVTFPDINWGRITQHKNIDGLLLTGQTEANQSGNLDIEFQMKTKRQASEEHPLHTNELLIPNKNAVCKGCFKELTLTPPGLYASFCPECEESRFPGISLDKTEWYCKGCSKYFTTKASLKRHHDRKKSCKDLCEKKEDLSATVVEVPDKPYVVEWVEQLMTKAISGDLVENPYCKHCEVEFANRSNLNKHLSKSVACDRLAKQEFLKLIT